MITTGAEMQVLVSTKPVDFRKQADGLAAIVQAALGADPFSGAIYVFRSKRMDRVKLLWWDGTGICLMTKRLEAGQFRWPPIEDGMMKLTSVQLSALLEGGEWSRVELHQLEERPQRVPLFLFGELLDLGPGGKANELRADTGPALLQGADIVEETQ